MVYIDDMFDDPFTCRSMWWKKTSVNVSTVMLIHQLTSLWAVFQYKDRLSWYKHCYYKAEKALKPPNLYECNSFNKNTVSLSRGLVRTVVDYINFRKQCRSIIPSIVISHFMLPTISRRSASISIFLFTNCSIQSITKTFFDLST